MPVKVGSKMPAAAAGPCCAMNDRRAHIRASTIGRLPPHLAAAVCEGSTTSLNASVSSYNSQPGSSRSLGLDLSLNTNDAGEIVLDDEEYARRKLEWVQRYTSVETLRKTFGTNRYRLWGDLWPSDTRRLYHTLLPQALLGLYENGLMRPHELAPLAYEARKAAKKYARERSVAPVRAAAMAFDGYRSCRDYGRWSHRGLSWDQVWAKYEAKIVDKCDFTTDEDDGDEIAKQICLRIIESSCRTNSAVNNLVLRDGEDSALAMRHTRMKQEMEMAAIAAKIDNDIYEILAEGAQKSIFFNPTTEQRRKLKKEKSRRVSQLIKQIQPAHKNYKFEGEAQQGLTKQEFFLLRIMTGDKIGSIRVQDLLEWMRSEGENRGGVDDRDNQRMALQVDCETPEQQRLRRAKKARVALVIGRMYQDVGMASNSLAVYEEALLLWKFEERDSARPKKEVDLIGGYTQEEIDAFQESDVYFIIQLVIEKSKVYPAQFANATSEPSDLVVFRCIVDAWVIYKHLSSQQKIRDRSMVFPLFSCLFMHLKTGHADNDVFSESFQDEYVSFYLNEAKLHGDPVHYTRALAMQAEVYAQQGDFETALEYVSKIVPVYDAAKHSEAVCKAYGTDRVAQVFSISATWEMHLHQEQNALERCNFVIRELLPNMDPKNVHSTFCLLIPIIRILKDYDGEAARMRHLFSEHVVAKFEEHFSAKDSVTPCLVIFKPLLLLLELYEVGEQQFAWRDDLEDIIDWAAEKCNGAAIDILDAAVMNFGWNPHTITAELCARLSEITEDGEKKEKLKSKALDLCLRARRNHQRINYPVALQENERVLAMLDPSFQSTKKEIQWTNSMEFTRS